MLLLCPELLVESVLRLATMLDRESPPRLESTDLLLVLISLLWELLLLVALFAFPKHLPPQLAPRAPCRSYSTVFKGSTDSSPQRSLPFHSDTVSSLQKNRVPPRRPRSGIRHPPPGQLEELRQLFRFSTLNFRITPEYNPGL